MEQQLQENMLFTNNPVKFEVDQKSGSGPILLSVDQGPLIKIGPI